MRTGTTSKMLRNCSIVMEVVGRAGVGKTVVCEALRERLRLMGGGVASGTRKSAFGRNCSGAVWAMRRPWLISLAWQLARWTPASAYGFGFWASQVVRIDQRYTEVRSSARPTIRVEDEGLFHYLKRASGVNWNHRLISRIPRPDFLVILRAPPGELLWRKARRGRMVDGVAKLGSESIDRFAVKQVRAFLEAYGEEGVSRYLELYNQNCLAGRLPAERFGAILEQAKSLPPPRVEIEQQEAHLRAFLEAINVKWYEVDNPDARSTIDTVGEILEIIRTHTAGTDF
jgi:hypothetical protein